MKKKEMTPQVEIDQARSDSGTRRIFIYCDGISEEEMSYIKSGEPGKGLLWVEGVKVPFEDDFPKDTTCYKLMTTRPGER